MSTMIYDKVQKMTVSLLISFILICQCFSALASSVGSVDVVAAPMDSSVISRNGMVRVYLSSLGNPAELDLKFDGGYILSSNQERVSSGTSIRVSFSSSTGQITLNYNGKTVNVGNRVVFSRHSAAGNHGIYVLQSRDNQNPYPGDLVLESVYSGGTYTLYPVVYVYIENYLYGVLPYEMGNSSSMEALKAQAVAARTYTLRMMEVRSSGRYDVKDTTSDQVYRGTPSGNANCVSAVDTTKGVVLMHGTSYITTFYSASNGGQTEIPRTGTRYAYMKVKDDPFDLANTASMVKQKTIYSDLNHFSNPSALLSLLRNRAVVSLQRLGYSATYENTALQRLANITVHTPMYASPSRLYTKMTFEYTAVTQSASGQAATVALIETFDIFSDLENVLGMSIQATQNELWTVVKNEGHFVLQARRYGHGMGMSQRGAMYMAQIGYSYNEILGFYYDGSRLVPHRFSSSILNGNMTDQGTTITPPGDVDDSGSVCSALVLHNGESSQVIIRSGASESAPAIGYVERGSRVNVYSNTSGWSQIQYGEIIGFVPTVTLDITGVPSNEIQDATDILGIATVKARDYVNLRQNGSMNSSIVATAPSGAKLTVFESHGSWARVQYKAISAYVNTSYISMVYSSDDDHSQEIRNAVVMTESGKGNVNLRKSASLNAQIIGFIPSGANVTVVAESGEWSKVSSVFGNGYMMTKFLKKEGDIPSVLPEDTIRAIVATQQGTLNLREKSQTTSRILTTIPRGATVIVKTKGELWCAVEYNQYQGYVMTKYLSFDEESNNNPDTPNEAVTATVVTPSGTLNFRDQPNVNARILMQLSPGTIVNVVARDALWSSIIHRDVRGYVMSKFLRFDNADGNGTNDNANDNTDGEDLQTAYVRTQSGALNIRKQPSLESIVLATIPRNATVAVKTYSDEWCFVYYGHYAGYVMTSFLSFDDAPMNDYRDETAEEDEDIIHMWVNTESGTLNLRKYSDTSADILATIPRHTQLDVLVAGDEWCYISYGHHKGYVMTRYLSDTNPALFH